MAQVIQMRRDTAANWAAENPVLGAGEWGLETDTGRIKKGDGTTAWNDLMYSIIPEAVLSSGADVAFDLPRYYGHPDHGGGAAVTGNIGYIGTGARMGMAAIMRHNDSVEPALPTGFQVIHGTYVNSVDNYYVFQMWKKTTTILVLVTITQLP